MESIIQELTNKLAEANELIKTLEKRLEWVNELLRGDETAEKLKVAYHEMLLDHSSDEIEIENLLKPYLSEYELYGDSCGTHTTFDRVQCFVKKYLELRFRMDGLDE